MSSGGLTGDGFIGLGDGCCGSNCKTLQKFIIPKQFDVLTPKQLDIKTSKRDGNCYLDTLDQQYSNGILENF